MTRPLRVFLCHAHSDKDAVKALYARLKREGVDVWLDKEKLLPGADWELEIRKAVREADVVVVCLSKQFNQAGFRQKEVRIALDAAMEKPEGEIFIIPARLEECDNLESLRKWHWVDLFEGDGFQRLILALRVRADKIGATLRQRGRATVSRPKIKDEQETASAKAKLEAEELERQRLVKEQADREAAEKEAAEKTRLEAEEIERRRLAKEQADREAANKIAREKARLKTEELEHELTAKKAAQEKLEREIETKQKREAEKPALVETEKLKATGQKFPAWGIAVSVIALLVFSIWGISKLSSRGEAATEAPQMNLPATTESPAATEAPVATATSTLNTSEVGDPNAPIHCKYKYDVYDVTIQRDMILLLRNVFKKDFTQDHGAFLAYATEIKCAPNENISCSYDSKASPQYVVENSILIFPDIPRQVCIEAGGSVVLP